MNIQAYVKLNGVLKLGSSGEAVRALQLALKARGYPLSGTAYFGTATDTAVEALQRRSGLTPDGEVGMKTAFFIDTPLASQQIPLTEKIETSRPLWLEAGIKLINVKEVPGKGDNAEILQWAEELGGGIAKSYNHDSIPWCALFANHCLAVAGLKGTGSLWALDFAGKWPSAKLSGPAVGAFAPMQRSGGGHIIQIVGRDQHGNIMGLGGNQSDQVSIVPFPLARLNQGFWWPAGVPLPQAIGLKSLPIVRSNGRVSTAEA